MLRVCAPDMATTATLRVARLHLAEVGAAGTIGGWHSSDWPGAHLLATTTSSGALAPVSPISNKAALRVARLHVAVPGVRYSGVAISTST